MGPKEGKLISFADFEKRRVARELKEDADKNAFKLLPVHLRWGAIIVGLTLLFLTTLFWCVYGSIIGTGLIAVSFVCLMSVLLKAINKYADDESRGQVKSYPPKLGD